MNIKNIISKSLINYDISNEKYESLIRSTKQPQIDRNNNKIIFKDKEFDYEILGIFDDQTKIWLWSWLIPSIKQESIQISRYLLNYGLNLTPSNEMKDQLFIKTQLTNSRFILEDSFQLEIHLSLCSYISNQNIKFLYPSKLSLSNNHTITIYYIVK
tara:strand:- start:2459 stop:2929 length:471 start_codon:yes stop_codon:yes gene_type:complete